MEYILNTGEKLTLNKIILDLNGTITLKGKIIKGVKEKIAKLRKLGFEIFILTGDARGNAKKIANELNVNYLIAINSREKAKIMKTLNPKECVAIGNARIDIGMFKNAKIRILTLQAEGIHAKAIPYVDIIIPSILDALDLFIDKNSFLATMKS